MEKKNLSELFPELFLQAIPGDMEKWKKETQFRIENQDWLKKSYKVAIAILMELRKQDLSKEQLSDLTGISVEEINIILKGKTDLTISTIAKFETALGINLMTITYSSTENP